jgi:hypothetical protein
MRTIALADAASVPARYSNLLGSLRISPVLGKPDAAITVFSSVGRAYQLLAIFRDGTSILGGSAKKMAVARLNPLGNAALATSL